MVIVHSPEYNPLNTAVPEASATAVLLLSPLAMVTVAPAGAVTFSVTPTPPKPYNGTIVCIIVSLLFIRPYAVPAL